MHYGLQNFPYTCKHIPKHVHANVANWMWIPKDVLVLALGEFQSMGTVRRVAIVGVLSLISACSGVQHILPEANQLAFDSALREIDAYSRLVSLTRRSFSVTDFASSATKSH